MSRKVRLLALASVLAAGAGILLTELVLRLFSKTTYATPAQLRKESFAFDPALFARAVFPQREQSVRGWNGGRYYISKRGYRGPDFQTPKPAGTIRIVVYGGSSVFDMYVNEGHDWPHRLAAKLSDQGRRSVEGINAGVPGNAAFDALGRLFAEGHLLQPDYVLLYTAWNDIKLFRYDVPLLRVAAPNRENPFMEYRNFVDQILCNTSKLYLRLRSNYYKTQLDPDREGSKPTIFRGKLSEIALRQFRITVESFVDLCRSAGAVPILVTEARLVTRGISEEQKKSIRYDMQGLNHETLCEGFERIEQILHSVASDKQVTLVDTSQLNGRKEFLEDHIHLTDRGSDALATLLAERLSPLLDERKRVASDSHKR